MPTAIAERVLRMVNDQAVVSASGKAIKMPVDTICVHGDTPGAVAIARQVRGRLEQNGHRLVPFDKSMAEGLILRRQRLRLALLRPVAAPSCASRRFSSGMHEPQFVPAFSARRSPQPSPRRR